MIVGIVHNGTRQDVSFDDGTAPEVARAMCSERFPGCAFVEVEPVEPVEPVTPADPSAPVDPDQ